MAKGSNKTGLSNFLTRKWSENAVYAEKIKECTLYITHGGNCSKLSASYGTIFAAIKKKLIQGCSSTQIMLLKMDISKLL